MADLILFFIIIFAGVFFSEIFRKFHLPYVVALILVGILIGPFGFQFFVSDPTIDFLGEIGLIFLMFMAGLETRISSAEKAKSKIGVIAVFNSLIPFIIGVLITLYFGYNNIAALMVGIIFMSSSIAIIIPSLEVHKLLKTQLGHTIVTETILQDVFSLIVLSVLLQTLVPSTTIPLPLFYFMIIVKN